MTEDESPFIKREVALLKCQKCGWVWQPKYPDRQLPGSCPNPKCRSHSWQIPKGQRKKYDMTNRILKSRS